MIQNKSYSSQVMSRLFTDRYDDSRVVFNSYDHLPRPCSDRDLPAQKMLQVFCSFGVFQ